jgi:hypothetical protein
MLDRHDGPAPWRSHLPVRRALRAIGCPTTALEGGGHAQSDCRLSLRVPAYAWAITPIVTLNPARRWSGVISVD